MAINYCEETFYLDDRVRERERGRERDLSRDKVSSTSGRERSMNDRPIWELVRRELVTALISNHSFVGKVGRALSERKNRESSAPPSKSESVILVGVSSFAEDLF